MDIRHFTLSAADVQALQQAERSTRDAQHLHRLQAVRLYGSGEALDIIVNIAQASPRTVRRWVQRYQRRGLEGLLPQRQVGNRRLLTEAQRQAVYALLRQYRPDQLGISERTFWNVRDVAHLVQERYGVTYKRPSRYRALLKAAGLSYQKATPVYRQRPREAGVAAFEADLEKKEPTLCKRIPTGWCWQWTR